MLCFDIFLASPIITLACFEFRSKKYQHLESQINIIGFIIKYRLIWYRLNMINIHNFVNKLGQSWCTLTFAKTNTQCIVAWREYQIFATIATRLLREVSVFDVLDFEVTLDINHLNHTIWSTRAATSQIQTDLTGSSLGPATKSATREGPTSGWTGGLARGHCVTLSRDCSHDVTTS
jgi:hypothetical protein